ncbi:MAG: TolC family protein, partial [Bacteroidia bacterium]|nr:TolC family protein [Bacteroidia bacterium]
MKRTWIPVILWMFLIIPGAGQEVITLESALKIGLENNYGINIAKNNLQVAANDATIGNAGFLPEIDALGSYNRSLSDAKVNVITGSELRDTRAHGDILSGGVNLNWTLFDGLNMFIRYDKLKKLEEMGELSARITIENTVAAITIAYYDIIRQSEEVIIMQEQVKLSDFRLDLAQTRYETGSGSEMEWLKARVERNADLASLADRETRFENSKTYLNQLLARDINTLFSIHDSILILDTLLYDTLRLKMLQSNHALQLSRKTTETHYLDIKSSRAQQWPSLDLQAGFNYYRLETEASFISYNRYYGPSLGITASMKIFDGLNLRREYQNAKVAFLTSELEYKKQELRLEAYLRRIYNDYMNQMQMIGFEYENLLLAEKNMEIAKESYSVGA